MSNNKKPIDQSERDFITGEERAGLSHSLFVRAGAGAGKTHCLQERVKNLLLHGGISPDKLA
ncbi:UvrD-helicase domain-containing protein, partial [Bdellovibrionota bacterium FG-1]